MDPERRRRVHRYIDGLASLPERREVEKDLATDPALAAYVRQHAAVWARVGAMPESIADPDPLAAIDALAARIAAADRIRLGNAMPADATSAPARRLQIMPAHAADAPPRRRLVDWSTLLAFASTAAAVAAIVIGGRTGHLGGAAARHAASVRTPATHVATTGATTVGSNAGVDAPLSASAALGVRRMLRLRDGTDVVLGPGSHLRYVPGRDGSRTVSLAGEAMFHVVHRADRPFIVRVAGATVEDLGTVFVVRAYTDAPTRVSVRDGHVSLQATGSRAGTAATILEAGASATLDSAGRPAVVDDATDADDAFAWTRGALRYRAAPLAEVAADLARAYDLDIRLADPALGQRVVQYAVDGEDAHAALDVLVATLAGVGYEQHGRVVTLYRR
jgi:ferric-dicitrate binding protein FerR (iron transport regulator)